MHTQPSSAHSESLALCFLSSAAKAADPAVTLASDKLLEVSGDVTVKQWSTLTVARWPDASRNSRRTSYIATLVAHRGKLNNAVYRPCQFFQLIPTRMYLHKLWLTYHNPILNTPKWSVHSNQLISNPSMQDGVGC